MGALLAKGGTVGADGDWPAALDRMTEWLWNAAMGDVLAAIEPAGRIRVVATGPLAILPFHAAWTVDRDAPTGRRYACDAAAFTFLPNARAGIEAERLAASLPARTLLAIPDPTSRHARPLAGARREATAASAAFEPSASVLAGKEATRSAVLARLATSDVLHFACHGVADVENPLDSALLLAGDDRLTVGDLLADRLDARLAVLSACETALTGIELLDEVIGLPSTLLHAGAAGVIGSLWKVPDVATTLLMSEFYRRWRVLGTPPATALRDAQVWVRDTTIGEKAAAYDAMLARGGGMPRGAVETVRDMLLTTAPAEHDCAGLSSWAGFTHLGA
jgi:CHAT domain-containing protein